jgi:serine/threonine-protein kinase
MPSQKHGDDHEPVTLQRGAAGPRGTLLVAAPASTQPAALDLEPTPLDDGGFAGRYERGAVLGEGGMGEVWLCRDRRIGRDVAMKVVLPELRDRADVRGRFEREVRVQGQLEHPSVVPVYDLGVTSEGDSYFTMKRLRGKTLAAVLDVLRDGDPEATRAYPRRRLLSAFTSLCLGVAFAHSRGVLHRDLKPANVMLGSYGEVHLLDWGIAKVGARVGVAAGAGLDATMDAQSVTIAGDLVGTPGYMPPEQALGAVQALDERSDVYALGAILFELLTLTPLVDGDSVGHNIQATLQGVNARASERAPDRDIPPELDAVCIRATAKNPKDRYASARDLCEAVERYLDGDRDLEQRRAMADAHATAAFEAAGLARLGGEGATAARARAVHQAGVALAIDPGHAGAANTMLELMLDAPKAMPPEARREFEELERGTRRESIRSTLYAYVAWILFIPVVTTLGVRDWPLGCFAGALMVVAALFALLAIRVIRAAWAHFAVYCVGSVAIGFSWGLLGWAVLLPSMAALHTAGYLLSARGRSRVPALVIGALTVTAPFAAQRAGLAQPSYAFEDGVMKILPNLTELPAGRTELFLLLASLGLVIAPTLAIARVRAALSAAEERLFLHAWTLRHLMPEGTRDATPLSEADAAGARRGRAPLRA